jgi:hypothetical protein
MSYYVYKICCDDLPEFVYVGSTKAFRERKRSHKSGCNDMKDNKKLYQTIRENGGWENWRMVLIEECGEISLTQARIKEEENRVKLNANLNMIRCHRTEEERKNYYEEHIEELKEYKKEYYENNKDDIKEKIKEYRKNNKEKIKEYKLQKFNCECGSVINIDDKARHFKTKIHIKYISEK